MRTNFLVEVVEIQGIAVVVAGRVGVVVVVAAAVVSDGCPVPVLAESVAELRTVGLEVVLLLV